LEEKGMRRLVTSIAVIALVSASAIALGQGFKKISEFLTGYEEVPSVSTTGNGNFTARISNDESRIDWELSYSDLEGAVQQAHIHFGQAGVNGGISVFLCTNLGNGPVGIQPCPAPPATISGTILAADVSPNIPATALARTQGINTGEIDELIRAIRAGATYVNVHSTLWPGGEIRSQIDGNNSHNH
jgi:CHRD domain